MRRILGLLDAHLKTRTFLVGERVTLADITVVCTLLWLYKQVTFIMNQVGRGWGKCGVFQVTLYSAEDLDMRECLLTTSP